MGRSIEERFQEKVQMAGPNECWIWTANTRGGGYGRFRLRGKNGQAHRLAWRMVHGMQEIPEGTGVCHTCDNPPCVNPSHLFLGTQKDNMQDASRKGRMAHNPIYGERHGMHKLTENDVREIRSRYADGASQRSMAKDYIVSRRTIGRVVRYENWGWLE